MANPGRLHRVLRLVTLLQERRHYTAGELARELGVSRRTVFRDLNALEMAHVPYYFDTEQGGYRIAERFFLPPINLTLPEALAILLLAQRAQGDAGLPLLSQSVQAAAKLESALPRGIRRHVGGLIDRMHILLNPISAHEGLDTLFEQLAEAIGRRFRCRLVYLSFFEGKQIRTVVRPLRLAFVGRAWYLIAYSSAHRETRTFKLGRIRKLTVTDQTFTEPADVNLDEYFGQAWRMIPEGEIHNVRLHFEPKVAGTVAEVSWHESQEVRWNDDGSIEYTVQVDGLGEITSWILGYGDQVEVITPAALRKRVAAVASAVLRKHRKERTDA